MDWQQLVALGMVFLTAVFTAGNMIRRRKTGVPKGTFGCAAVGMGPANQSSIVFRARKGARPEITVKLR